MGHFGSLPDPVGQKSIKFSAFRAFADLIGVKLESQFLDPKWAGKIEFFPKTQMPVGTRTVLDAIKKGL